MVDRNFWCQQRVFLTGHTGFKGSWLTLWLHDLGAKVTGFSLAPPTTPNLFTQANVAETGCGTTSSDIRDFSALKMALADCQPTVILHMAAQTVVRTGYEDPIDTYSTNVMGTVHLFEAVRQLGLRCVIVNVTSDKCYQNREWMWGYRENEPMGDRDPYASSKGCSELVTKAYRESYFPSDTYDRHGVALASARAGNVIGGGDWTKHQLIPDLMRAFMGGEPCLIRNPSAVRPWQFVLEPLHGYLMLAQGLARQPERFARGWNFGPTDADAQPVSVVADQLVSLWRGDAKWVRDTTEDHPHEAHYLKLDTSLANNHLGWRPCLRLNTALELVVDWYHNYQKASDMAKVTTSQIKIYEHLLKEL